MLQLIRGNMDHKRRRCTVSCILVAICIAQSEARPSRGLSQVIMIICSQEV